MSAEPPPAAGPGSDDPADTRYPNTARIWNYQLGGQDNFAVDRKASEAANAMVRALGVPDGADTALESRHLLQRMVDYLLGQGVRQFQHHTILRRVHTGRARLGVPRAVATRPGQSAPQPPGSR